MSSVMRTVWFVGFGSLTTPSYAMALCADDRISSTSARWFTMAFRPPTRRLVDSLDPSYSMLFFLTQLCVASLLLRSNGMAQWSNFGGLSITGRNASGASGTARALPARIWNGRRPLSSHMSLGDVPEPGGSPSCVRLVCRRLLSHPSASPLLIRRVLFSSRFRIPIHLELELN